MLIYTRLRGIWKGGDLAAGVIFLGYTVDQVLRVRAVIDLVTRCPRIRMMKWLLQRKGHSLGREVQY